MPTKPFLDGGMVTATTMVELVSHALKREPIGGL